MQKQLLCRLQKPQFALRGGNGIEFAIGVELIGGVVGIKDRAKEGRHVCFKPYLGRCFMAVRTSVSEPTRGIDDAPFPPQIYDIRVDTSRNLHVDTDVNARERVEATAMASVLLASMHNMHTSSIHSGPSTGVLSRTRRSCLRSHRSGS